MSDNIADATVIDFPTGSGQQVFSDSMADKTAEPADPTWAYTAWYVVTSAVDAEITMHLDWDDPSFTYGGFSAYRDDSGTRDQSNFTNVDIYIDDYTAYFPILAGEERFIIVACFYDGYHSPFTLTVGAGEPVLHATGPLGSFTNPIKISITNPSVAYQSPALHTADFPADDGAGTNHPIWFLYVPAVNGTVDVDTELGTQVNGTRLALYLGDNYVTDTVGSVTLDQSVDFYYGQPYSRLGTAVTADKSYWLLLSSFDAPTDSFDYVMRASGAVTVDYGDGGTSGVVAPAMDTVIESGLPGLGSVHLDAAPADTVVEVGGRLIKSVVAPPAESSITVRAPSTGRVRRVLGRPDDNAVVPVDLPQFTVAVQVIEGEFESISVDFQGDIAGQLTNGSPVFSQAVPEDLNVNLVVFNSPIPLVNGSYQWRARLVLDGVPQSWTPAKTFTVNTAASDATVPISWTVTNELTSPHLWEVDPPAGVPGDQIRITGQGLPAAPTVTINAVDAPVVSVTHVPATAASLTVDRTLADVEHDVIVVTVPIVSPPGGALIVRGNY